MSGSAFSPGGALAGLVFVVLGVLFFLDAFDLIRLRVELLLPVALIALGVAIVIGALWRRGGGAT